MFGILLRLSVLLCVCMTPFYARAFRVKAMTYNTNGDSALNDGTHYTKIAQVITQAGADIIAFQELHNNWYTNNDINNAFLTGDVHSERINNEIKRITGGNWYATYLQTWKKTIRGTGHGIGVSSRWSFEIMGSIDLDVTGSDGEPRKALFVYVSGAPEPFIFIATHFLCQQTTAEQSATRAKNVSAITTKLNEFRKSNTKYATVPVILGGDLNTHYDGNISKKIAGTTCRDGVHALGQLRYLNWTVSNDIDPSITFPKDGGKYSLDYIACYNGSSSTDTIQRLMPIEHYAIVEDASDHDPAVTVFVDYQGNDKIWNGGTITQATLGDTQLCWKKQVDGATVDEAAAWDNNTLSTTIDTPPATGLTLNIANVRSVGDLTLGRGVTLSGTGALKTSGLTFASNASTLPITIGVLLGTTVSDTSTLAECGGSASAVPNDTTLVVTTAANKEQQFTAPFTANANSNTSLIKRGAGTLRLAGKTATSVSTIEVEEGTLGFVAAPSSDGAGAWSSRTTLRVKDGGTLLLDKLDCSGYDYSNSPIEVEAGGLVSVTLRDTLHRGLSFTTGGTLRVANENNGRALDLYYACPIKVTESGAVATIESVDDAKIVLRNSPIFTVAEGATLKISAPLLYSPTQTKDGSFTLNGKGRLVLLSTGTLSESSRGTVTLSGSATLCGTGTLLNADVQLKQGFLEGGSEGVGTLTLDKLSYASTGQLLVTVSPDGHSTGCITVAQDLSLSDNNAKPIVVEGLERLDRTLRHTVLVVKTKSWGWTLPSFPTTNGWSLERIDDATSGMTTFALVSDPTISPTYHYAFDGNYTSLGTAALTIEDKAPTDAFIPSPQGQALCSVLGMAHPYGKDLAYGSGAYTISTSLKSVDTPQALLFAVGGTTVNPSLALTSGGAETICLSRNNGNTAHTDLLTVAVPTATTQYHLYTLVCDRTTVTLYVDGVAKGSAAFTVPGSNTFQWAGIYGGSQNTGYERVSGVCIDDWRLYQRALTATEVATLATEFPVAEVTMTQPLTATVSNTTWSAQSWYDATAQRLCLSRPFWQDTVDQVTLTATAATTVSLDTPVSLHTLTTTGTGALTVRATADVPLTVDNLTVQTTTALTQATLAQASIATNGYLTLSAGSTCGTLTRNLGTVAIEDTATLGLAGADAPSGTITLAEHSSLTLNSSHTGSASGNKLYTVTGASAETCTLLLTATKNWGMTTGSRLRNVTLQLSPTYDFWIEEEAALDASVDLETRAGRSIYIGHKATNGKHYTVGTLSGSGTLRNNNGSDLTITMTRQATTFAGNSDVPLLVTGPYPLTLAGTTTGVVTVGSAATVALTGHTSTLTLAQAATLIVTGGALDVLSLTGNSTLHLTTVERLSLTALQANGGQLTLLTDAPLSATPTPILSVTSGSLSLDQFTSTQGALLLSEDKQTLYLSSVWTPHVVEDTAPTNELSSTAAQFVAQHFPQNQTELSRSIVVYADRLAPSGEVIATTTNEAAAEVAYLLNIIPTYTPQIARAGGDTTCATIQYSFEISAITYDAEGRVNVTPRLSLLDGTRGAAINGSVVLLQQQSDGSWQPIEASRCTRPTYDAEGHLTLPAVTAPNHALFKVRVEATP